MKSSTEEGGRLTDSVSSRPKSNQVGLSPISSQPSRLEMKLHEVHFAVKLSKAEDNLTAKCTECNFITMPTKRLPISPRRSQGLLGCLQVNIGTKLVSHPPFSVVPFIFVLPSLYHFLFVHKDPAVTNNFFGPDILPPQLNLFFKYTRTFL